MRNWPGLAVLTMIGLMMSPATAVSSGPFDGSWSVIVACSQAPDGAKGYNWSFTADVRDGRLLGQYSKPGLVPSATLSGQIQAKGEAVLRMDGLSGDPDHAAYHVNAGTPFHFTANARFADRSGSGKRNEVRPCDLTFAKT